MINAPDTIKAGGPFSTIDGNSHVVSNVADPVSAQDAATKNYVDTHSAPPPSGTGFWHITAGVSDSASKTVDLGSGDVTGILGIAGGGTGIGTGGSSGQVLTWVSGAAAWATPAPGFTAGGDLSGTSTSQSVDKIHGASVPAAGSLTTGNVLQVTGASALGYAPINLAGGANFVTGALPVGNQANQTLGGDVTGTTAAAVVAKVNGATIPAAGSLTVGNAPYVSGSSTLAYSALNLAGGVGWITGTLPVGNGGSGLTAVGASGTYLRSNGSVNAYSLILTADVPWSTAGVIGSSGASNNAFFGTVVASLLQGNTSTGLPLAWTYADITLSGTTYTLSNTENAAHFLRFVGTPSAPVTVTLPTSGLAAGTSAEYWIFNNCGQDITVVGSSGTGITVKNGLKTGLYYNGTNMVVTNIVIGGDLSATGNTSQTVIKINGATVPAAGSLTTGNAAYVSGASALTYSALNLAGGGGWITGTLPVGNGGTGLTAVGGAGTYLRSTGSVNAYSAILQADLPTIALTSDVTASAAAGSLATTVVNVSGTGSTTDFGTSGATVTVTARESIFGSGGNAPLFAVDIDAVTTNATPLTVSTRTPTDHTDTKVNIQVLGRNNSNNGDVYSCTYSFLAQRNTNVAFVPTSPAASNILYTGGGSAYVVSVSKSGSTWSVSVTGVAATTIHWSVVIEGQACI